MVRWCETERRGGGGARDWREPGLKSVVEQSGGQHSSCRVERRSRRVGARLERQEAKLGSPPLCRSSPPKTMMAGKEQETFLDS